MKPTSFWRAMAVAGGQLREQGRDASKVAERVMPHINDAGDRLATCLTRGSTRQGLTN